MNAAALAHRVELMCRKQSRWMMGEAPHHAVLVVDRHKSVAVERVVAVGGIMVWNGMTHCVSRQ